MVRGPSLVPGATVAGGRYRLLNAHGGSGLLRFWHAFDTVSEHDVALTIVGPAQSSHASSDPAQHDRVGGRGEAEGPQAVLRRTLRLDRIESPGVATVLDVVLDRSSGIVVAEWTAGRSLAEVAATGPCPVGAARAVVALAGAADAADRLDAALALDHPDRIRISTSGNAVLAFPGISAGATHQSDVQGLGAILYALVAGRWPLPAPVRTPAADGQAAGMPQASRGPAGAVVAAHLLRAGVPFELSAVIDRALQPAGGHCTAAAVRAVLKQTTAEDQQTDLAAAILDPHASPMSTTDQRRSGAEGRATRFALALRSRRLFLARITLSSAAVLTLAYVTTQVMSLSGGG